MLPVRPRRELTTPEETDRCPPPATTSSTKSFPIRYWHVDMYASAYKHGISKLDVEHAVRHALAVGDQEDGKVLYLGPDRAGNLLEVVSVRRDDETEVVIHAMAMRSIYESFLHTMGEADG